MDEAKSWMSEVEEVLAKQALALNYEHGMTSRILPVETKEGVHSVRLMLDLTHSSLDFDLEFLVRFTDDASRGVSWQLAGPEGVGKLWDEQHRPADDFKKAVAGLPYFVQGFFAGRAAKDAVGSGASGHA